MIRPSVQVAAGGWLLGSAVALVIQGLFRRGFAKGTDWGYNGGWQREIAVWNLGTIVAGTSLLRMGEQAARAQVRGYAVLSTLFGINHLVAALRSRRRSSNWAGAISNAAGLTLCLAALNSSRTPSDQA
ncbi:hypothetical protein [Mycobacteroides abscessus]|uniref:hypothetical protein n=1 Tax=Mycobacteroides abscessus TaxID=36809 RepID=UPI0019D0DBD0|nr:hypothetical protein [Mycobacteroides abscessus]MBN7560195.1 hypothetical protein [Mycobacteroides abscessus subsp. abscessus]